MRSDGTPPQPRSTWKAIFTDIQFWIPLVVFVIGLVILILVWGT